MAEDTGPIIKWLRFTRTRYSKIKWPDIEKHLGWEEDTIDGVDLSTFSYQELTSIKYALIELIEEEYSIKLGRVDV